MKTAMALVRNLITGSDNLGDLLGERDSAVAKLAASREEIVRLKSQRLSAESFEDAEAVSQRIARVTWTIDQITVAILPALEQRIIAAQSAKQRAGILRHQKIHRDLYPRLKTAIQAASAIQVEAVNARAAAQADLGEHVANQALPHLAYRGLLLPDLIELWSNEQDRVFLSLAAPAPQPAVAAVVAPKAAPLAVAPPIAPKPAAKPAPVVAPVAPVAPTKPRREPRRDRVAPNGRLISVLRPGLDVNGYKASIGDQIALSAEQAEVLVRAGSCDYVNV
jgi:hypothetical protein